MNVIPTSIADVLIIEPDVFADERGFFVEHWNERTFPKYLNGEVRFVQDNYSRSRHGVLRGLHYQVQQPQGKLLQVIRGRVFDVAVDLRQSSPSFRQWVGVELSDHIPVQYWIPPGFAHGFLVLSEIADIVYKVTDYYAPEHERCLIWNDPTIGINWPTNKITPTLSGRDRAGTLLKDAELFP